MRSPSYDVVLHAIVAVDDDGDDDEQTREESTSL